MKSKSLSRKSNPPLSGLTPNQQTILELLHQQSQALSAQELYRILRKRQAIGLATVYRALEVLKRQGLIRSRIGANGESFYTPVEPDQHYLTCVQCGQSFPLDHCPLQEIAAHLQLSISFKIYYHTLEFFGLCEPCNHQTH